MRVTVYGTPAPQGSKRHVGRGILVESASATLEPWREALKTALLRARQSGEFLTPYAGPVAVAMTFTLRKPASAPKRTTTWPSKKPDVDKLVRAAADQLVAAGVLDDDARIVEITAAKRYPLEGADALDIPGAVITVTPIAAGGA